MYTNKYVFVDAWAWLALSNRKDIYHELARKEYAKMKASGYRLVTSDYVLDEVITALFKNVAFSSAIEFIDSLLAAIKDHQIKLERITESQFKTAWSLRKKFHDKPDISFTDLTSFVLMQELAINLVFTGDAHFNQVNLGFEIIPKEP